MQDAAKRKRCTSQPISSDDPAGRGQHPAASARDRLVRLAYRFLWNRDDAEDVVHDALIAARQHAGDLREPDRWMSWTGRIVVRRCHERIRQMRRWRRYRTRLEATASRHEDPGPQDRSDSSVLRGQLRQLLLDLPRRQHEVIVLRHLQGMSYEEIGDVLGISAATARVHARAARERLRSLLLRRHPGWFDSLMRSKGTKP
jgi:RNA polymerase sigma-70 factor (ECF subfamily)